MPRFGPRKEAVATLRRAAVFDYDADRLKALEVLRTGSNQRNDQDTAALLDTIDSNLDYSSDQLPVLQTVAASPRPAADEQRILDKVGDAFSYDSDRVTVFNAANGSKLSATEIVTAIDRTDSYDYDSTRKDSLLKLFAANR